MKKFEKIIYAVLIVVFTVIFIVCAVKIGHYFIESKKQSDLYNELAGIVEADRPTETTAENSDNSDAALPSVSEPDSDGEPGILPEYSRLYLKNPDCIGWLRVPDTDINYPVMQTPDRPDYYLHRNFYGEYSSQGAIYAGETYDVSKPSDSVTLHGHNMKDGSMFADLNKFKKEFFLKGHPTFTFDTLTQHHQYEIFAVFTTTASVGKGFKYYNFVNASDEDDFDSFVSSCISLSHFDTGIVPQYGDKLVFLSTCDYSMPNGRFVVAARRIN